MYPHAPVRDTATHSIFTAGYSLESDGSSGAKSITGRKPSAAASEMICPGEK